MDAQTLRAQAFKALHERDGAFVIPNPWDVGSAKLLARLGFEALAPPSAGYAFSQGRPDGGLTLDDTLANVRAIVAATDLPVAVDLENGFADDPAECAQSILRAAAAGAVGGSIEDATGREAAPIYCFEHAVARIEAAVAAIEWPAGTNPHHDLAAGDIPLMDGNRSKSAQRQPVRSET